MKIQSVTGGADLQACVNDSNDKWQIRNAMRDLAKHEADSELEGLINEIFTQKHHPGMFSHWPTGMVEERLPVVYALILERCKDVSLARQLVSWMLVDFGRRMMQDMFQAKAAGELDAFWKAAVERQIARELREITRANRQKLHRSD